MHKHKRDISLDDSLDASSVLLIASEARLKSENSGLKKQLEDLKQAKEEVDERLLDVVAEAASYRKLAGKLKESIAARGQ
jgi:uncharacterized coiled-coil DUF342 family protein